jgi:hypothetical protein
MLAVNFFDGLEYSIPCLFVVEFLLGNLLLFLMRLSLYMTCHFSFTAFNISLSCIFNILTIIDLEGIHFLTLPVCYSESLLYLNDLFVFSRWGKFYTSILLNILSLPQGAIWAHGSVVGAIRTASRGRAASTLLLQEHWSK